MDLQTTPDIHMRSESLLQSEERLIMKASFEFHPARISLVYKLAQIPELTHAKRISAIMQALT
jgi:hypothetical protein